jgi:hypothetical protein
MSLELSHHAQVSRSENLPKIQGTLQGMKNIEGIEVIKMAQVRWRTC